MSVEADVPAPALRTSVSKRARSPVFSAPRRSFKGRPRKPMTGALYPVTFGPPVIVLNISILDSYPWMRMQMVRSKTEPATCGAMVPAIPAGTVAAPPTGAACDGISPHEGAAGTVGSSVKRARRTFLDPLPAVRHAALVAANAATFEIALNLAVEATGEAAD